MNRPIELDPRHYADLVDVARHGFRLATSLRAQGGAGIAPDDVLARFEDQAAGVLGEAVLHLPRRQEPLR